MRRLKVIHCYPGSVGSQVIRRLAINPNFELVGALVNSEAKEGLDIGELCGAGRMGVTTTRNVDHVLAMEADCVL